MRANLKVSVLLEVDCCIIAALFHERDVKVVPGKEEGGTQCA